ncbi:MAG TPA: anti-sigma factor, partial [Acidimicrobiales bacterium]
MSAPLSHAELQELLGAYALDAVDGDEREAVELHLRDCPSCRAEVNEHREVAALLAHTGMAAPEGIWARIQDELEPAPPALRVTVAPPDEPSVDAAPVAPPVSSEGAADVVPIGRARRMVSRRMLAVVAAAAAVIVAVVGSVAIHQSTRLDHQSSALSHVSVDRLASIAQSDHKVETRLTSPDHRASATAVVTRDGRGYLETAGLPAAGRGRTYQLWGQVDGAVLS